VITTSDARIVSNMIQASTVFFFFFFFLCVCPTYSNRGVAVQHNQYSLGTNLVCNGRFLSMNQQKICSHTTLEGSSSAPTYRVNADHSNMKKIGYLFLNLCLTELM
jgi:hypothetical protein